MSTVFTQYFTKRRFIDKYIECLDHYFSDGKSRIIVFFTVTEIAEKYTVNEAITSEFLIDSPRQPNACPWLVVSVAGGSAGGTFSVTASCVISDLITK